MSEFKWLEDRIIETLANTDYAKMIACTLDACDRLSKNINDDEHLPLLIERGIGLQKAKRELDDIRMFLSREYLDARLGYEFGKEALMGDWTHDPVDQEERVRHGWRPLGVLLHIAAGNIDALPVFSVIEGLLTGNINILKLPSQEDGLSLRIINALVALSPEIADHIYVFDFASTEVERIRELAALADAVVTWGGDAAISAVRQLATPNTKLIEWGHKISFAYIANPESASDDDLEGIAFNMCDTQQLFCNSCQGIYVNTEDLETAYRFAGRFHKILERVANQCDKESVAALQLGILAQKTLELHTEQLESAFMAKKIYKSPQCSVVVYDDMALTLSYQFKNCWVRRLPKADVLKQLKPHKNHLQTVALVCETSQRAELESVFMKTGVVRLTTGQKMSKSYCGIPHDGEYALRRYMKLISMD